MAFVEYWQVMQQFQLVREYGQMRYSFRCCKINGAADAVAAAAPRPEPSVMTLSNADKRVEVISELTKVGICVDELECVSKADSQLAYMCQLPPSSSGPTPPPPPSPPPPSDASLCQVQADGTCKSMLNGDCAVWRDSADVYSAAKQKDKIEGCMGQDCVQALEGVNACKYLDSNGFCYAYGSAQTWCENNAGSTYCKSLAPWAPGTFPSRGSSSAMGSLSCVCYPNCGCTRSKCFCTDANQLPIGPVCSSCLHVECVCGLMWCRCAVRVKCLEARCDARVSCRKLVSETRVRSSCLKLVSEVRF